MSNYRASLRAYAWDWTEDNNRYKEVIKQIPNLKPMSDLELYKTLIPKIQNTEDRRVCEEGLHELEGLPENYAEYGRIMFGIHMLLIINGCLEESNRKDQPITQE